MLSRFPHAFRGLRAVLTRGELRLHLVLGVFAVAVGWLVCLTPIQWGSVVLAIGLVLTAETLNSAVEGLADVVSPHHHRGIGRVKDIAAAGVLFSALTAAVLAVLVFLPPVLDGRPWSCHGG